MLAIEEANSRGGVQGRRLEAIIRDDRGEPEKAQKAVDHLVNKDRVVAVIGEMVNSRSLAGAPVCQQARVPMISPAATDPRLTQVGDYVFRACYTDPLQGRLLALFAARKLNLPAVGVFKSSHDSYSRQIADSFVSEYRRVGGRVVQTIQMADVSDKLEGWVKDETPPATGVPGEFVSGTFYQAVLVARMMKQDHGGLSPVLFGPDGWDYPPRLAAQATALDGSYYLNHFSADDPASREFVNSYQVRYHSTPDALAALAYDSARLLIQAIGRADRVAPPAIRDALSRIRDFKAATGTISFGGTRDPVKSAVIVRIQSGRPVYFARVGSGN